jgi:hypothetical protein
VPSPLFEPAADADAHGVTRDSFPLRAGPPAAPRTALLAEEERDAREEGA